MPKRTKKPSSDVDFLTSIRVYCRDLGVDPHEFMADVLASPEADLGTKLHAAKALAEYMRPKLKSVEVKAEVKEETHVRITFGKASAEDTPA